MKGLIKKWWFSVLNFIGLVFTIIGLNLSNLIDTETLGTLLQKVGEEKVRIVSNHFTLDLSLLQVIVILAAAICFSPAILRVFKYIRNRKTGTVPVIPETHQLVSFQKLRIGSYQEKVGRDLQCKKLREMLIDHPGTNITISTSIQFEHLEDDFKSVCREVGIDHEPLPYRNRSVRKHYSYYYDESLREMAYKKFKEEIDYFGYEFSHVNTMC